MQGIDLKFVLFSALTSSRMGQFLQKMHGIDVLPLTHPNGYRQVMFVDYKNIYGRGHSALFLHTSPHKQYYLFVAPSIKEWLSRHWEKLRNN
jgi:hypothetical protein